MLKYVGHYLIKERSKVLRCYIHKGENKIIKILGKDELNEENYAEVRSMLDLLTSRYEELILKDSEMRLILL